MPLAIMGRAAWAEFLAHLGSLELHFVMNGAVIVKVRYKLLVLLDIVRRIGSGIIFKNGIF